MRRSVRVAAAVLVLALLVARTVFYPAWSERFDNVSLLLLAGAVLLLLLPWERLSSLTLGSVAVSLDSPQVAGALSASLDRVSDARLRRRLETMNQELTVLPGSRVLWVDDHPNEVLGERRILRSLGVEVVTAASTAEAVSSLRGDGDFDLLVTDVQREGGTTYEMAGGEPPHEGTSFVVVLRAVLLPDLAAVPSIREIPVPLYAAYDRARLLEFTRRAREIARSPTRPTTSRASS